jgi:hypothetical protein
MSDPVQVSLSPDKRTKVLFLVRPDGQFQFSVEHLRDGEDQGQSYSIWAKDYPDSGLYPDLDAASRDARLRFPWL